MSSVVQEAFPDVPERCLRCPGLLAAACQIENWLGLAAAAGTSKDNPDNPLRTSEIADEDYGKATAAAATAYAEFAQEDMRNLPPVAKELWEQCSLGPTTWPTSTERRGLRKQTVSMVICGSRAPLARFFPYF